MSGQEIGLNVGRVALRSECQLSEVAGVLPKLPISVVVITQNAASSLEACLSRVGFAAEILVVDSGSTDQTLAIAARCGARILHKAWLGFGPQKQWAVDQATYDWVLCLDADEQLSPELAANISAVSAVFLQGSPCFSAYRFARCNRFLGRYLRHGEGYPDWSVRLFDRRCGRWSDDVVHEKVCVTGSIGFLAGDLLHDSAETLTQYLHKQNRYTALAAEAAANTGKSAGLARACFSPVFRFFKFYFLRRGFLDGFPGFVHVVIGCCNSFFKYVKMLEKQRSRLD